MFYLAQTSPSASMVQTVGPHDLSFLDHQIIKTENEQITDKIYDESEMRIRQKQRIMTPEDPCGVKQHLLNTGAKEKSPAEQ